MPSKPTRVNLPLESLIACILFFISSLIFVPGVLSFFFFLIFGVTFEPEALRIRLGVDGGGGRGGTTGGVGGICVTVGADAAVVVVGVVVVGRATSS